MKQVQEIVLDYSTCFLDAPDYPATAPMPSKLVTSHFKRNSSNPNQDVPPTWSKKHIVATFGNDTSNVRIPVSTVQCSLRFVIPSDMDPPVLFYYRLSNFYQNHRRYAKSFNTDQLLGKAVSADTIRSSDCTPLTINDTVSKPYYPCGLAANSQFNDTFSSPVLFEVLGQQTPNHTYVMQNETNIAWSSDRKLYGDSAYKWTDVVPPPNWQDKYPHGYSDDYHPDLINDAPFQAWMRLAGLPTFSKLAQRNDTATMQAGSYQVDINHRTSPSHP